MLKLLIFKLNINVSIKGKNISKIVFKSEELSHMTDTISIKIVLAIPYDYICHQILFQFYSNFLMN